ncbi:MAG: hypothetical protein H6779_04865 [Candidatus Nomurabacteria bacterium]|nr:hypothetical protein [Candidatus Nomurabacteria bacterium]USN87700.1 MAG: hypothetical protein H6779_04865 [Candidatus Nomurabacteria bacterium]
MQKLGLGLLLILALFLISACSATGRYTTDCQHNEQTLEQLKSDLKKTEGWISYYEDVLSMPEEEQKKALFWPHHSKYLKQEKESRRTLLENISVVEKQQRHC